MNKKYHQLKVYPTANPCQPTNMIRQHVYVTAAFEPTVPTLDNVALSCQSPAQISMQKSVGCISPKLTFAPAVCLGTSQIHRCQHLTTQSSTDKLMKRLAVVSLVGDYKLYRKTRQRQLSYQSASYRHLVHIGTGNMPSPQHTGFITNRMQRITLKPLAVMTRPTTLGIPTAGSGAQKRRIHGDSPRWTSGQFAPPIMKTKVMPCITPSVSLPFPNGAPAKAARSPLPVASINTFPSSLCKQIRP